MIEHGITTTKAEYWLHLLVPLRKIFRYRVSDCRAYISLWDLPLIDARSKNMARTVTGRGYLVWQGAPFIQSQAVPDEYFAGRDFSTMNDRSLGLIGEAIIERFLFDQRHAVQMINTRAAQIDGAYDADVNGALYEFKTENMATNNLFVQRYELNHQPLEGGEQIALPMFDATPETAVVTATHFDAFVGYDENDHFVHYCHCGQWAAFGFGVRLAKGELGTWYCAEHKPGEKHESEDRT